MTHNWGCQKVMVVKKKINNYALVGQTKRVVNNYGRGWVEIGGQI